MTKKMGKISDKTGLPPGSLIHIGHFKEEPIHIFWMNYDESGCKEWEGTGLTEKTLPQGEKNIHWLHLNGVHQPEVIELIGEKHDIHSLLLEDILNTEHHPKLDETDDGLFLIAKKPSLTEEDGISFESVNIHLGDFGVATFVTSDRDPFEPVRSRIRNGNGKIRKRDHDYLVYALLDTVVDSYLIVIDQLQGRILEFEEEVLYNARPDSLLQFQTLQRTVLQLGQMVQPMRDVVAKLCRIDNQLINESTKKYFEDILDHMNAVSVNTHHFRELLSSILELHVSMMNTKMNQVVKLLTVFAAIFMPLTFLAGIYGMNFTYMPELEHPYGYFILLLLMAGVALTMVFFFRRRKWL